MCVSQSCGTGRESARRATNLLKHASEEAARVFIKNKIAVYASRSRLNANIMRFCRRVSGRRSARLASQTISSSRTRRFKSRRADSTDSILLKQASAALLLQSQAGALLSGNCKRAPRCMQGITITKLCQGLGDTVLKSGCSYSVRLFRQYLDTINAPCQHPARFVHPNFEE